MRSKQPSRPGPRLPPHPSLWKQRRAAHCGQARCLHRRGHCLKEKVKMNRIPRNIQLLQQIAENNPFKKTVAGAFDIGADFQKDMEALGLNRKWSPEARQEEAAKLRRKALR